MRVAACRPMPQTPASLLVDRMTVHNRRLLWELQTINEIAEGISQSLELDDVLTGALQRIVRAFDAVGASIRLRDERTGAYEMTASVGPSRVQRFWNGPASWPSEQVIATRTAVVVEDLAPGVPSVNRAEFMMRSGISLPLLAADDLLGVLSVGASSPCRFDLADERLLAIIAGQIVVARSERASPRLGAARQAGVGAHLRRHQRSDRRVRSPRASAARQYRARGAPRPRRHGDSRIDVRRSRVVRRRVSRLRDRTRPRRGRRRTRRAAEITLRRPADPERDDVSGGRPRLARRISGAGREERHRGDSVGAATAAHERRARKGERPVDGDARSAQVHAGAVAPGGKALGDRPARRGRRARAEQPADERDRVRAAPRGRVAVG